MKKTVKVIRQIDAMDFQSKIQDALNEGFELQSSTAYPTSYSEAFVAVLTKEEA